MKPIWHGPKLNENFNFYKRKENKYYIETQNDFKALSPLRISDQKYADIVFENDRKYNNSKQKEKHDKAHDNRALL